MVQGEVTNPFLVKAIPLSVLWNSTFRKSAITLKRDTKPNNMNNLEYQTELNEILNILRDASNRARRIAESTQNPPQVSLDMLSQQVNEARQRLAILIQD
jgi:DNA-nicking Smr family endonuclease